MRREAFERALRPRVPEPVAEPGVRVVRSSFSASATVEARSAAGHTSADDVRHLWVRLPDEMRIDEPFGIERLVRVYVGDRQWLLMGSRDAIETEATNPVATHPLLFPANFADRLEIVARDPVMDADRQAVQVRARPRDRFHIASLPGGLPDLPIDASMFYASDEFLLTVDLEYGVLLRFEARFEGSPFEVIEMTDVAFNEELEDGLFALQPPPGGFLPPPPERISATLEQLADQVAFVLYAPAWPDQAAAIIGQHCRYQPADPPRDTPAVVTCSAPLEQQPRGMLWIRQSDQRFQGEPDTRWGVHPRGLAWVGTDRPNDRCKLRLHMNGTYLHLEASSRPLGWLERVAAQLIPVEPDARH